MSKDEREFYQSIGICPQCRINKLLGFEKRCIECRAKNAESKARKYDDPENKKKMIKESVESKRKRKQLRREKGLCIECGKREPKNGIATCSVCRERANVKKRAKYNPATLRKDWIENGKCFLCGDECEKGYKVCKKHHQMYIDNAQSNASIEHRERLKKAGEIAVYKRLA